MKKVLEFLKKKVVMIVAVAVAVLFLGIYIYLLARPINYNSAYTYKENGQTISYTFTKDKVKTAINGEVGGEISYVLYEGRIYAFTTLEQVKALSKSERIAEGMEISAFGIKTDHEFTCGSTVAFAIYGTILMLAFAGVAGLSVFLFIKDTKNTKKAEPKIAE